MSLAEKTKMIKYALSEFKKATHMNNAQIGAMLTSPASVRTKLATDAIAVPLKTWLKSKVKSEKGKALIAKIPAHKFGTALMYVDAANAGTQMLRDFLPTVAKTADWTMAIPFNILNQTLGRIPGLGAFFRAIHNFITEGVSKVADFFGMDSLAETGRTLVLDDPNQGFETNINWRNKSENKGDETVMPKTESKTRERIVNHPSFYENLDLHKTFSIPGAYTKKTVVNGTLATPKLAAHRVCENPMPDRSALIDRLNQKFSLIKAVRGLSATMYNLIDLANYERYAKINLLQYYVLKKVVKAAKTYSLVQTAIGDNIITSLGFVPSEVRQNLASYETLLCQWHRFITNNIPMNGTWIKRLEYLVGVNIPDYSDQKVATIHMFSVSMTDVYSGPSEPRMTFDCIPGAGNNSYAVMLTNFNNVQTAIVNNTNWQQLIADYFGAFGAKCMWADNEYPAYKEPLDLRNGDNDLNREQIKNGFYLNSKWTVITINAGVANSKRVIDVDSAEPLQLPNYQFGNVFDATTEAGKTRTSYNTLLDHDTYLSVGSGQVSITVGSTNKFLVPDINGIGAQVVNAVDATDTYLSMSNHETIYTLHKDSYSEGEYLDISQFKNRSIGAIVYISDQYDFYQISTIYKTQEYALMDTTVYVFGSNGTNIVEQTYNVCNEAISDDDLQDTESPVDYPDEIMCWALIDWMPFCHFTFFGYVSAQQDYYPRDLLLIDMDSFGSLDDRAFATSVNYSIYSLQGANLRIDGKTKRISNLADVYKDKPSKRD